MEHQLIGAAVDPTKPIAIDFRKWGGIQHWQAEAAYLGEDQHGIWVWGAPGTIVWRPGVPDKISEHGFVKVITAAAWWTAMWPAAGPDRVFVDICTPVTWSGNTATLVDLDLDVVQSRTGSVVVEDEDEFIEHQRVYGYPQWVIDGARASTAEMVMAVESAREPFATVAAGWLQHAQSG